FVVLVDAADDSAIGDATAIVGFFRNMSSVPFVIAANRVDSPDRLEALRQRLGIEDSVEVLAVDARDRESVKQVLLALLYRIMESME
ncbi:MAG: GTP-binding protein, partial [Anaerosomatales bacterium]